MNATFICALSTPKDERFSASSVIEIPYIADESEKVIISDARDVFDRGNTSVSELIEDGILKEVTIPEDCFFPQGFPVTVRFPDGSTKVVNH